MAVETIVNKIVDLTELTYAEIKCFVMLGKEMLRHVQMTKCTKVHAVK